MKINKMRLFAALGVMGLILSVSCTRQNQKLEYGLEVKDTLRININSEPPSLDWNRLTDTTSSLIVNNIMEGLVSYDFSGPEITAKPALASEWEVSKDSRTWTFTLRKDVLWTDGVSLEAQHFADGWERLLDPTTASEYAYSLYAIKNAEAFNQGKIKDFKSVGVKVNEKGQLVVELEAPMSFFPFVLTHTSAFPIRKDLIAKFGDKWTRPENIQTLGPFYLKTWDHDKAIVLERSEKYYGEKPKIKNVLCYMINEFSTAINLFDSKRLDMTGNLPDREINHLKNKEGFRKTGALISYYYGFNTKKPPFDDPRVRKAFVHAFDRKQLLEQILPHKVPLTGWIPPGMLGYEAERGLKFDVELAKKLLAEAGYGESKPFPRVTLAFNTNENHQRIAEFFQSQMKRNLGVDVDLANEEWKVYLSRLRSDTPHMYRMGWVADYPDPDNFFTLMTSNSGNNHTKWGNDKFDSLVTKGSRTLDMAERRSLYSEAHKILVEDDVPVLPVYADVTQILIHPRVQNFPDNPLNKYDFSGVTLK